MSTFSNHLIQCRCILPQFRQNKVPIFHKFLVFSVINDTDEVVPKIVQCPNCGILHKVIEINKSDILNGRESSNAILSIDDIKTSLPNNIISILESYNLELPKWEEVKFVVENGLWGSDVVLVSEEIEGMKQGKVLKIKSPTLVKIESFIQSTVLS